MYYTIKYVFFRRIRTLENFRPAKGKICGVVVCVLYSFTNCRFCKFAPVKKGVRRDTIDNTECIQGNGSLGKVITVICLVLSFRKLYDLNI